MARKRTPSSKNYISARFPGYLQPPYVVGESQFIRNTGRSAPCTIRQYAKQNLHRVTLSERRFASYLDRLNGGVLKGTYRQQHVISGKWIVDFFFPQIRLAVEIDGEYHGFPDQMKRDAEKAADCTRFDITLLRVTNADVSGEMSRLTEKLRAKWKEALHRDNQIIGRPY